MHADNACIKSEHVHTHIRVCMHACVCGLVCVCVCACMQTSTIFYIQIPSYLSLKCIPFLNYAAAYTLTSASCQCFFCFLVGVEPVLGPHSRFDSRQRASRRQSAKTITIGGSRCTWTSTRWTRTDASGHILTAERLH